MAAVKGTATVDFGGTKSHIATLTVPGQTGISATDYVEAWFMGQDSTADHSVYHHSVMFPLFAAVSCGNIVAGTSFDITIVSELPTTGQVKVRWVRNS
jgi:hypothetical protein